MAHATTNSNAAQLQRLGEQGRAPVAFVLNGQPAQALQGDTVLTAVPTQSAQLRTNEFAGTPRAGFCMMGACQDCWVTLGGVFDAAKARLLHSAAGQGMQVCTTPGAVATAAPVEVLP